MTSASAGPPSATSRSDAAADRLVDRHDVLLADLDGTLYRGRAAVPGAVDAVAAAAAAGLRTVYVTNNASRTPDEVAAHLTELGFPAEPADVATSAQAAAALLGAALPAASPVLVVGTSALADEVRRVGLEVTDRGDDAAAVVQGHSPDTGWRVLAEATVAVRAGATWVACNLDPTVPTERGHMPGNGTMVGVVRTATRREPVVAGKPAPTLLVEAARRTGARRALVVGDRLDTDIEGGRAAGLTTLFVLTGVSDAADLLAAPPHLRPDHVGADLDVLLRPAAHSAIGPQPGWSVQHTDDALLLRRTDATDHVGSPSGVEPTTPPAGSVATASAAGVESTASAGSAGVGDEAMAALLALCAAQWSSTDQDAATNDGAERRTGGRAAGRPDGRTNGGATGVRVGTAATGGTMGAVTVRAVDDAARRAVVALGLSDAADGTPSAPAGAATTATTGAVA